MKVGGIKAVSVAEMILEVVVGSEVVEVVVCEEKGMEVKRQEGEVYGVTGIQEQE